MIQLKYYPYGIHYCVTVVGKWIFESICFALPFTKDNFDYCCINDNEIKLMNDYKGLLKTIMFFTKENTKSVLQKWKLITCAL